MSKAMLTIISMFVLVSCFSKTSVIDNVSLENDVKSFEVQIRQNISLNAGQNNNYTIEDNKFELLINNEDKNIINIFAYHSDEMFNRHSYPIKCEDTVIFHPATAIINSADENKEVTLTINREMQFNVFTPEKRLDENGMSIIRIKDIADTDNKFNGIIYLTIFIDLNNNNIIESNEIKNISLAINRSQNSNLFRARIHVSTMGGWIRDINNQVYRNNYFYIRISNDVEKARFFELFGQEYGDNAYSSINRIRDLDCSRNNMYIIFSPITAEIELFNNPYRYAGESRLIFDTRINSNSNRGRYVFYREYRVDKSNDIFEIWINTNGTIRRVDELKLSY